MNESQDIPPHVVELADACVRFVHDALGLTLDGTAETLPILDHYLKAARGEKPEVLELLAPALGAYFGQVVLRTTLGAHWYCEGTDYRAYRLEWEPFFLSFNPIGVAVEVLTMEDAVGFGAHFQVLDEAREPIARSLSANPDIRTEDYYTFSVRLEALEQIADVLSGIESHQSKRRLFSSDVYRATRGDNTGRGEPS